MSVIKGGLNNIAGTGLSEIAKPKGPRGQGDLGFDSILKERLGAPTVPAEGSPSSFDVKFSAHAIDRIKSRGIKVDSDVVRRIGDAIAKAEQKGAKESLMLLDDAALIVSVKNRTVITAMDKEAMRENVFTNIDSTVIL